MPSRSYTQDFVVVVEDREGQDGEARVPLAQDTDAVGARHAGQTKVRHDVVGRGLGLILASASSILR